MWSEPRSSAVSSPENASPSPSHSHHHYAWWLIMCLCGVDYFSTLGYQPSIAFEGAGTLAPIATLILVLVTLLGALPIYCHVAGETPDGVGSVGMIERMFSGWTAKVAVLVLVGFAATDFVITKTLSAADAAAHLISNPLYTGHVPGWMQGQMAVTMFLLVLLGGMFLKGYGEVVGLATILVVAYISLTAVIIAAGVWYLVGHPAAGRIRNTRRLLVTAALLMSIMLLGSSLVTGTDTIIPADELRLEPVKGKAIDRALAYIAHGESPHDVCPLFGRVFGTVYDVSTILILWFAGASAMAGLLNMVPRYLPRYGMAPEWAAAYRPLVIAFTVVNLLVTWCFRADVSAQGSAYATGVLVLMTSAAIGSLVDVSRKPRPLTPRGRLGRRTLIGAFALIAAVFVYTTIANICERPDGIIIASIFIACVLTISITSRVWRSRELRLKEFRFADDAARMLWTDICADGGFRVLVPHRPGHRTLDEKEAEVRRKHRIPAQVPLVFLEVHYGDPSEFENAPLISARQEDSRFIIVARDVASVSHTIAQIAIEMSKSGTPLDIVFGWSLGSPLRLAAEFVLFGQGDVPKSVFGLLQQALPDPARRPTVLVG